MFIFILTNDDTYFTINLKATHVKQLSNPKLPLLVNINKLDMYIYKTTLFESIELRTNVI